MTPAQAEKAGVKLNKVEYMKEASENLLQPVKDEMLNHEMFVTENAYQILKFHGSYQQDQRDLRKPGNRLDKNGSVQALPKPTCFFSHRSNNS